MRFSLLIMVLFGTAIAFEVWRLRTPEVVRLEESWEFSTPEGVRTGTRVVELRQFGAIPYLPGGAVGRSEEIGGNVMVDLPVGRLEIRTDPRWFMAAASRIGNAEPAVDMEGLRNEFTTGFIRRVRAAGRITIARDTSRTNLQRLMAVTAPASTTRPPSDGGKMNLQDFETAYPGVLLTQVRYVVTDQPISAESAG